MDKIIIDGGCRLRGDVEISGSKNASLPVLTAAMMAESKSIIANVPELRDIATMVRVLETHGVKMERHGDVLTVDPAGLRYRETPYELVKTMRASIYVMGPLLARLGRVSVSLPGGCIIGRRPINLHLEGFMKMGADIKIRHGYVDARTKKLKGARINLEKKSVGATANLMMAASMAQGTTVIKNAAMEPHIVNLGEYLNAMGAKICGLGTSTIIIEGVKSLTGCGYSVIPDYIEAGTFLVAGAITRGEVGLLNVSSGQVRIILEKLSLTGAKIRQENNRIYLKSELRPKPVGIKTQPYPGFPTDMQAQWMALMCLATGTSVIEENIWESRFMHVSELERMGADIRVSGNRAVVKGVSGLSGTSVMVSDLRAGAALVLAGLAASGTTTVSRVYHLDRGYEAIEKKLRKLGARIKRVSK